MRFFVREFCEESTFTLSSINLWSGSNFSGDSLTLSFLYIDKKFQNIVDMRLLYDRISWISVQLFFFLNWERRLVLYVEIIVFFMELSINFNGVVSLQNKLFSKQTNSSLFATKIFSETALCMEHYQCFRAIATKRINFNRMKKFPCVPEDLGSSWTKLQSEATFVRHFWICTEFSWNLGTTLSLPLGHWWPISF